jgi:hypothetical protein
MIEDFNRSGATFAVVAFQLAQAPLVSVSDTCTPPAT